MYNAIGPAIAVTRARAVQLVDNVLVNSVRIVANKKHLKDHKRWPFEDTEGFAIALRDTHNSMIQGNIIRSEPGNYSVESSSGIFVSGRDNNAEENLVLDDNVIAGSLPVVIIFHRDLQHQSSVNNYDLPSNRFVVSVSSRND